MSWNQIRNSEREAMNKAKAYRRLRKKNEKLASLWAGMNQSILVEISKNANQDDVTTCSVNDTENKDLEEEDNTMRERYPAPKISYAVASPRIPLSSSYAHNELTSTTNVRTEFLPDIKPCFSVVRKGLAKASNHGNLTFSSRPITSRSSTNGYQLLQTKLDAIEFSNPMKRKASRSYSSCSGSGFHSRKQTPLSGTRRLSADTRNTSSREANDSRLPASLHLPTPGNMRQKLHEPEREIEPKVQAATLNLSTPRKISEKKQSSKSMQFFFPSYNYQKTLKITTSHNPKSPVYHSLDDDKTKKFDSIVKKVSFEDNDKGDKTSPNTQFKTEEKTPFHIGQPTALTSKNLEIHNSMTSKAELRVPSQDDLRVLSWVKEQEIVSKEGQVANVMFEEIKEVEEEMCALSNDSDSDIYTK